jgi:hypothetical protein
MVDLGAYLSGKDLKRALPFFVAFFIAHRALNKMQPLLVHRQDVPPNHIAGNRKMERYIRLYQYHPPQMRTNPVPEESCGTAPRFNKFFEMPSVKTRSRNEEDRDIFDLFFTSFQEIGQHGVYLEMGAFDGITETNTRLFDICLGWTGLLIEANPSVYPKLLANRPNAHRMSYAPSCSIEDEANNKTLPFHPYPWTNAGLEGKAKAYAEKNVVDVPCGSLTPVIKDILGGHVDFFSLDVEGAEALVVENIDFDEIVVELMIVENINTFCKEQCESRDRVRTRMKQVGYVRYSDVIVKSDLYVHPSSKFSLPKAYKKINAPAYITQGTS